MNRYSPKHGRLMSIQDVADRLNIHRTTLHRWISRGIFPEPMKINGYNGRYEPAVVEAWIKARPNGRS